MFEQYADQWSIIGHVALAALLGGMIGLEREWAGKPAGLRTHMMVCGGAALLMLLGNSILTIYEPIVNANNVFRADPLDIMHAVIVGISFIGAGTIITRGPGQHVEGLTTAAGIWLVTAIGIAVAMDQFVTAVGVTVLMLIVLVILGLIERKVSGKKSKQSPSPPKN